MSRAAVGEVAGDFNKWHDKAMHEPVAITSHGQESVVLLSAETFRRLVEGYREIVPVEELEAAVSDAIVNSEIPEQHRWDSSEENVSDERRGMVSHALNFGTSEYQHWHQTIRHGWMGLKFTT
jgi:antitoxin StbD